MSRRARTLSVAGALTVVLAAVALLLPVPYVALGPGPVVDTLGPDGRGGRILAVTGARTYPTTGKLQLTTVAESDRLDLVTALRDWLAPHRAVVPREVIDPPGQTTKQVEQQNAADMAASQQSAQQAAFGLLGIRPTSVTVTVGTVPAGSPSTGKLRPGDVLTSVNGVRVRDQTQLRTLVGRVRPGRTVRVGYRRGTTSGVAAIVTTASTDKPPRPLIGVSLAQSAAGYPVSVKIGLQDVGGPSAGLMFSLGIVDLLTPGDLAGGRTIAGTGTIDATGAVGPIGGIQQKLAGARSAGATVFLVPTDNCAEALGNVPRGLRLVRVTDLRDAYGDLTALRAGHGASLPHC